MVVWFVGRRGRSDEEYFLCSLIWVDKAIGRVSRTTSWSALLESSFKLSSLILLGSASTLSRRILGNSFESATKVPFERD